MTAAGHSPRSAATRCQLACRAGLDSFATSGAGDDQR
jgi:hypothetical protein